MTEHYLVQTIVEYRIVILITNGGVVLNNTHLLL